jgi:23S rRNA pseudouridine1911/1915/1917 synthase
VHPAGERFAWALIGLARSLRPGLRLDLVHRLDRDTSGVVVLTKDVASNAYLKRAIAQRRVEVDKQYVAIVRGQPIWESTRCDFPIGLTRDSLVRLRRGVREDGAGEQATTCFEVLQRMAAHALVRCELHTGRTHQIRVHLEALGHPILGDRLYGQLDEVFIRTLDLGLDAVVRRAVGFPRQALHCWKMQLPHPRGGLLQLEAPLPEDMARVVEGAPPSWPDPGADPGEVLIAEVPPEG